LNLTPEQAATPDDVVVLTEIRDLLAQWGPAADPDVRTSPPR
jgi:hypothetical protein